MARHIEDNHQRDLFTWARHIPALKWMHAIPNGGKRNRYEAARLKGQGVTSGILDVFLPVVVNPYHGLYIELKIKPNKPTSNQLAFIEHAETQGYKCVVAYNWLEARMAIQEYMKWPITPM